MFLDMQALWAALRGLILGHGLRGRWRAVESRFAIELAGSERLTEDDLAGVADLHDGAGHPRCRNRILDELGDGSEITLGHYGCARRWCRGGWCGYWWCARDRRRWRRTSAGRGRSEAEHNDADDAASRAGRSGHHHRTVVGRGSAVAVDAGGRNQHYGATLLRHGAVIFGPVVMGAATGGERRPQQ